MRVLPVGWSTPPRAAEPRRISAVELTRATHAGREAQAAALVAASCFDLVGTVSVLRLIVPAL